MATVGACKLFIDEYGLGMELHRLEELDRCQELIDVIERQRTSLTDPYEGESTGSDSMICLESSRTGAC